MFNQLNLISQKEYRFLAKQMEITYDLSSTIHESDNLNQVQTLTNEQEEDSLIFNQLGFPVFQKDVMITAKKIIYQSTFAQKEVSGYVNSKGFVVAGYGTSMSVSRQPGKYTFHTHPYEKCPISQVTFNSVLQPPSGPDIYNSLIYNQSNSMHFVITWILCFMIKPIATLSDLQASLISTYVSVLCFTFLPKKFKSNNHRSFSLSKKSTIELLDIFITLCNTADITYIETILQDSKSNSFIRFQFQQQYKQTNLEMFSQSSIEGLIKNKELLHGKQLFKISYQFI